MRYSLMALALLASSSNGLDAVRAQTSHDISCGAGVPARETRAKISELRSLLLKAEMNADDERTVALASQIVELTEDIDAKLPANLLIASDRLSALKALFRIHSSLARETAALEAQSLAVALVESLYGQNSEELLHELEELEAHYGNMGRLSSQLSVAQRALKLARKLDAEEDEFDLLCSIASRNMAFGKYGAAKDALCSAERILQTLQQDRGSEATPFLVKYLLILGCYQITTEPDYEKATKTLEMRLHLMETTPGFEPRFLFLIELYSGVGKFDKAEQCVQKNLASLRRHPNPLRELRLTKDHAHLLLRQGRYDKAIHMLKDVAYFPPGTYGGNGERITKQEAIRLLAEAHVENGDYATAQKLLEELTKHVNPELREYDNIVQLMGQLHLRRKEYARAEKFLDQAFSAANVREKENPHWMHQHHYQYLLRDLIQLYRETNRPEKAEEIIRKSGIVEEESNAKAKR